MSCLVPSEDQTNTLGLAIKIHTRGWFSQHSLALSPAGMQRHPNLGYGLLHELQTLCRSSEAGCFKHKTEIGIIYQLQVPRKLKKIQVKAFAALPFLEDGIPPVLVQDKPPFRYTLKFYIMAF